MSKNVMAVAYVPLWYVPWILIGIVITGLQQAVLLAHKHVPSSEEAMFTLDLKLKSLAGNSIRSICLLWRVVYVLC